MNKRYQINSSSQKLIKYELSQNISYKEFHRFLKINFLLSQHLLIVEKNKNNLQERFQRARKRHRSQFFEVLAKYTHKFNQFPTVPKINVVTLRSANTYYQSHTANIAEAGQGQRSTKVTEERKKRRGRGEEEEEEEEEGVLHGTPDPDRGDSSPLSSFVMMDNDTGCE